MVLQARISLLTTQLLDSEERMVGLEAFITANSAEDAIKQVFVLAEKLTPDFQRQLECRHPKLRLLPCAERPDFADLVQAAIDYCDPEEITIIVNSNIWFDLQRSDFTSLLAVLQRFRGVAFTLTRRQEDDPERLLSVDGLLPEFLSSDAWIFAGLPHPFPYRGIYLGMQDMEQLVIEGLLLAGYRLANAGCWLRAIRLEASSNDYSHYNIDWLQQTILANPLLAASGIPPARVVLPPAYGEYNPKHLFCPDRFTRPWDEFRKLWILLDLRQSTYADCRVSLLWLLFLARSHDRHLIACVDEGTDLAIVQLLDRFHGLSGRSLCMRDLAIERLKEQDIPGDLCWVSSPAVIGPELLSRPLPMVCLNCCELRPIKGSWLYYLNLRSLYEQIKSMQLIDPASVAELASPDRITWLNVQLITCTYRSETFLPGFLAHSDEWISTTAAYGHAVLHAFCDAGLGQLTRRQLLAALEERHGFLLQLQHDPGLYGSWNALIERSEEEFISNANPDDRRSPDQLGLLVDRLRAHPDRMVASSSVVPIYRRRRLDWSFSRLQRHCRHPWFTNVQDGYGLESLYLQPSGSGGPLEPNNIPHCSPVWRRQIHQQCGLFDEHRYGSEADWALWCGYAYHGGRFCHSTEPLSGYYVNPGSYGRSKSFSAGCQRIVAEYLRPDQPSQLASPESRSVLAVPRSYPRRMRIHGLNSYYGEHRVSNNLILESLVDLHDDQAKLRFIWFLESYFIWGEASGERKSGDFSAIDEPWFGVLHVPPLTPKWAGNQFAELFFLDEWRASLKNCRALIALSAYMARDLRILYPRIPVFSLKHPVEPFCQRFDLDAFLADPKVVLVGYWLRRHRFFYAWSAPLRKIHLLKRFSFDQMQRELQALGSLSPAERDSVQECLFLPAKEYDSLLSSSLVYLSLYEASGNNSVIECIAMGTPFIADRHPAIEEYVGCDYPLLLGPGELEKLSRDELLMRTCEAHRYLMAHPALLADLTFGRFRRGVGGILDMI